MKRIAINGFGRIGRTALRLLEGRKDLKVVAINDLTDAHQLSYLYKYDSVHRTLDSEIGYDENHIYINGDAIEILNEKDPAKLPWKKLKIDIVLECTGVFTSKEKCMAHIEAGAKKVIISAPAKDDAKTIVFNVNDKLLTENDQIISCASCTTNCLAPVVNLLNKKYKVVKGFVSTVHSMTNDQETLDIPHKKGIESRRGRAASQNIIPTSTGAASQIGKVIPSLNNVLDGIAFRVPTADGSLIDLTVEVEKKVTKEQINKMFKSNENDTIKYTDSPIVSSDIIGNRAGAIVDGLLTNVVEKDGHQLVKVVAWYDNETGYTSQMIRTMEKW